MTPQSQVKIYKMAAVRGIIFIRDIFDKNNKNLYDRQVVVVCKHVGLIHKTL